MQRDDITFPSLPLAVSRVLAPCSLSRRAARAPSSQSLPSEQVLDASNRGTLFIMCLYAGSAPCAGPRAIGRDLKSMVAQMGGLDT